MLLIYNLIQLLFVPLILLVLPVYLIRRPEKCKSILPKLGYKLERIDKQGKPVVWFHALSVGEVTSVLPLIQQLKQESGDTAIIVFSVSTVSGHQLANRLLSPYCDRLIYAPLDIFFIVRRFLRKIDPDLFILVETDFWPNLLHSLAASNIPPLLVNGRVSDSSINKYNRFRFFFYPIFDQFDFLCMQTAADADKMTGLGISGQKVKVLGNLKFAESLKQTSTAPDKSPFPENHLTILAGSTHDGEERILIDIFKSLCVDCSEIHLAVAPRNITRVDEITALAESCGLTSNRYSTPSDHASDITIIDTIGDLSGLYGYGDICFIGGSLIDEGGHNPIEAARCGKPVIFGPHMDDFLEISEGLIEAGGAFQVAHQSELQQVLASLISSEPERTGLGRKSIDFVSRHQHVITDHLSIIRPYL